MSAARSVLNRKAHLPAGDGNNSNAFDDREKTIHRCKLLSLRAAEQLEIIDSDEAYSDCGGHGQ
jgi:hypothetical protein